MRFLQAALVAFLLLVFAQGAHARTRELTDASYRLPEGLERETLVSGIKRALAGRGWEVSGESDGVIDSTLHVREHTARIRITYDAREVAFAYVDSVNLDYMQKEGKRYIHGNYLGWINYLINDLNASLGGSGAFGEEDWVAAAPGAGIVLTADAPHSAGLPLSDADPVLFTKKGNIMEVVAIAPDVLPTDDDEPKKSWIAVILAQGPKSRTVAPGRYQVKVACVSGTGFKFTKNLTVERGYAYEFVCGGSPFTRLRFGMQRTRQ